VNLLNGQPASTLDLHDRGLHYGDGLFETIAVDRGEPLLWPQHMARLLEGCRRLRLPPPDTDLLRSEAGQVLAGAGRATLKILITRGSAGRGYRAPRDAQPTRLLMRFPWPDYPVDNGRTGVVVRLCETRLARNPALAGLKHLNRLEQVLARGEWDDPGIAEGLMLDTGGCLIEGTMSNVFLVRAGGLVTPALDACGVAGVMRARVLEAAASLGIPCATADLTPADAEAADALFLTSSLIGLWPVRQLGERRYAVNPIVQTLQQQLFLDHACA
jgi:4-amino-4-deoxychorismate lyase